MSAYEEDVITKKHAQRVDRLTEAALDWAEVIRRGYALDDDEGAELADLLEALAEEAA